LDVPELDTPNSRPRQLAAPLQLASAPQRHRRCRTHVQTQLVKKQRLDASQLAHYPFDRLKIDRSFVRELATGDEVNPASGRQARWMLQAIASLGAGLGTSIVAEGVETSAQAEIVRQAGVTLVQGNLIARPAPEAELASLVLRLAVAIDPTAIPTLPAHEPQP
jgi:hypothetical protein